MKWISTILGTAMIVSMALADDLQERAEFSRDSVKAFAGELKAALKTAINDKGPVHAIRVCQEKAPEIMERLSSTRGQFIGRTSRKCRNPGNVPDVWELKRLEEFESRKQAGEPVSSLEHSQIVISDGKIYFRYMKAIPTEKVCLTCHGENIAPEICKVLDELYDEDRARGFRAGDIRGAFTISQPIAPAIP